MKRELYSGVLSEKLRDCINERRVKAAVFLTYQFDPEFFELHVIPLLFNQVSSTIEKVSLALSENAIREGIEIAVYFDRQGLITGGRSASLDYRRFDVSRSSGVFHPKNIFLLLQDDSEEDPLESLLVVTTSANLTRSGWWENVEAVHILEVSEGSKSLVREDLLGKGGLLSRLEREDKTGGTHAAIEAIRAYLVKKTDTSGHRKKDGLLLPRMYVGKQSVPEFLSEEVGVGGSEYCLEIISPYFENTDDASTLKTLIESLGPKSTRIYLPKSDDGKAQCRQEFFETVRSLRGVDWGELPAGLTRWSEKKEITKTRFVHAKVYRLFSRSEGKEFLFTGSVNLTGAAHSTGYAGNFETGMLLESLVGNTKLDWWMMSIRSDFEPMEFIERKDPAEDLSLHQVSFEYNWAENTLRYFWVKPDRIPKSVVVRLASVPLFEMPSLAFDGWVKLPAECAESVRKHLQSTTFLELVVDGGNPQWVLVREEGMECKPPLAVTLTPKEILEYWSLLSPEQRADFWERRLLDQMPEALVSVIKQRYPEEAPESMFDRFAGIFHAFSGIETRLKIALEKKRPREVEYLLFGKKSDSLDTLIEKILEKRVDGDPINDYVTLLCARQLMDRMEGEDPSFDEKHKGKIKEIKGKLKAVSEVKKRFVDDLGEDAQQFLEWFERMFFLEVPIPSRTR